MNKTETKVIERTTYCVYCGKQAILDFDGSYHHNDYEEFYYCNCESAKLEMAFKEEEWMLKRTHDNELYDLKQQGKLILDEIEYKIKSKGLQDSMKKLNKQYGINN